MKKIALTLVFLLLASVVFAGTVDTVDGYFWIKMSDSQKISTVFGYIISMATVWDFCNDSYDKLLEQERSERNTGLMEMLNMIKEWSSYPVPVSEIVEKLNRYYSDSNNLKAPMYLAVPYIYNKEWW